MMIQDFKIDMGKILSRYGTVILATLAILVASAPTARAQTFDSTSDGSDGALVFPNAQPGDTIIFDPRTFTPPLDPDGDRIYHFTTINIPQGVTVRLLHSRAPGPLFWLATGAVQIDGTIDLKGENGHPFPPNGFTRRPSEPGSGGFPGGVGAFSSSPGQRGYGPGGGSTGDNPLTLGAGHILAGASGGGPAYGNNFLVPLIGGSGGGGSPNGRGGGGGGGALLIASSVSIAINGSISANGGVATANFAGGGSGGAIHLQAPTISGAAALGAVGGFAGGSSGRIRLDTFDNQFTGTASPAAFTGLPRLILPTNHPLLQVVSVAGVPFPDTPQVNFDVLINEPSTATVEIEARDVPLGTVVQLHVFSENGDDQTLDSTPLDGTFEQSTATVTLTYPFGLSRNFLRATWTP